MYRPRVHSAPGDRSDGRRARRPAPQAARRRRGCTQWKNALLDLSLRNRLINYTDRARRSSLAVPDGGARRARGPASTTGTPSPCCPADELAAVQTRARHRGTAATCPQDAAGRAAAATGARCTPTSPTGGYPTRLRDLAYKARTIVEETGANNLYLALGTLVWELDGRPLRSPLVLVPVAADGRWAAAAHYRLALDESGASHPELLPAGEAAPGARARRPGAGRPGRRRRRHRPRRRASRRCGVALAEHGLPYRVEPTADLAVLQFAKFRLWKDLDEHWADFTDNPLVAPPGHDADRRRSPTRSRDAGARRPRRAGRALPGARPTPRSCGRSPRRRPAARSCWRARPAPASRRPSPTCSPARSPRASGCCSSPRSGRRWTSSQRRLDAVGMGPFVLDLHDKGSKPADGARADPAAPWSTRSPSTSRSSAADGEDLRSARRVLARYADRLHEPQRRRAVAVLGAHGASSRSAPTSSRCRCRSPAGQRAGRRGRRGAAGAGALPGHRRPGPARARATRGRSSTPRRRRPRRRCSRRPPRFDAAVPALPPALGPGAAAPPGTPADLAVAGRAARRPGRPLDVLDETRTPRWTAATGRRARTRSPPSPRPASRPRRRSTPTALAPAARRDLRGGAGRGGVGLLRAAEAAGRRPRPARAGPPAGARRSSRSGVPELTGALSRLQTGRAGAGRRGAAPIPGLALPRGLEPVRRRRRRCSTARSPGCAGPGRPSTARRPPTSRCAS